jgi:DNA-binding NarL/FixJ family response regulator
MTRLKHRSPFVASKISTAGERDVVRLQSLSQREREAASLVSDGLTNKDVAGAMGLSEQGTKNVLSRVFRKLGVHRRLELVCRFAGYFRNRYLRND